MRAFAIILLVNLFYGIGQAQTCCSGGVPVSSNLGLSQEDKGTLQLSLTADFNILKSLFAASERLDDDLRTRSTQSYILRGAFTFSSRWQVEGFLPFVRQTRSIIGNSGNTDFESSFGIGDAAVLMTYTLLDKAHQLRLGLGPQIPLGSFSERNARGLFLVEDLQPGSGAWDLILFSNYQTSLSSRPSTSFYLNSIYNISGKNDESRAGLQTYQFGNELQLIGGVSDQLLLFNQIIQPGLAFRYRRATRDKVDNIPNSGTGGEFAFIRLSNAFQFSNHTFSILVELPMYRFVNETQLAPSFSINLGWLHRFQRNNIDSEIIQF